MDIHKMSYLNASNLNEAHGMMAKIRYALLPINPKRWILKEPIVPALLACLVFT